MLRSVLCDIGDTEAASFLKKLVISLTGAGNIDRVQLWCGLSIAVQNEKLLSAGKIMKRGAYES